MLTTYTLYIRDGREGPATFEPVLAGSSLDLMDKVREVLARHPDCEAIDVYFGDTELFRVDQTRKP